MLSPYDDEPFKVYKCYNPRKKKMVIIINVRFDKLVILFLNIVIFDPLPSNNISNHLLDVQIHIIYINSLSLSVCDRRAGHGMGTDWARAGTGHRRDWARTGHGHGRARHGLNMGTGTGMGGLGTGGLCPNVTGTH